MKEISQFIPELSSVCKIYSGVISGNGIACEDTLTLVASVHELCNGRQFEDMTAIDFFNVFNLHQTSKPLEVCKNEKIGVCYLIHQLSEKVDKGTRSEWIGAMLRNTGIDQEYYRSKYREPICDPPSKKNKEFAEALKEILG